MEPHRHVVGFSMQTVLGVEPHRHVQEVSYKDRAEDGAMPAGVW